MSRFYPDSNCDVFFECPRGNSHDLGREVLRKNQLKNKVCFYDDPSKSDPNRSRMCVWGAGEQFKQQTGFIAEKFIKSRIRSDFKLPTAGRNALWKINRVGCVGMKHRPLLIWNLKNDWLRHSSFYNPRKNKN